MAERVDVVVIEDDPDISELVEFNLVRSGYTVKTAVNGVFGLTLIESSNPRLVLLDIMMPELDGISVLRNLRESGAAYRNTPVILLSAKGEESDVVVGLELGADDYVSKPFSPKELVSRVRAVLRRTDATARVGAATEPESTVKAGPIVMNTEKHEVFFQGRSLSLTLAEFNLLQLLISKPGRVFTRDQLLEKITGGEAYVIDRNVDVHIRAIRKKLEADADFIQTVRGVGYKCREA